MELRRKKSRKSKRKRNEYLLLNDSMGEGRCKEARLETTVLRVWRLSRRVEINPRCAIWPTRGSIMETACGDIWIGGHTQLFNTEDNFKYNSWFTRYMLAAQCFVVVSQDVASCLN
jgi:hypothetical protein